LKYADGGTMESIIRSRRRRSSIGTKEQAQEVATLGFSEKETMGWISQLILALKHMHAHKVAILNPDMNIPILVMTLTDVFLRSYIVI